MIYFGQKICSSTNIVKENGKTMFFLLFIKRVNIQNFNSIKQSNFNLNCLTIKQRPTLHFGNINIFTESFRC